VADRQTDRQTHSVTQCKLVPVKVGKYIIHPTLKTDKGSRQSVPPWRRIPHGSSGRVLSTTSVKISDDDICRYDTSKLSTHTLTLTSST